MSVVLVQKAGRLAGRDSIKKRNEVLPRTRECDASGSGKNYRG